MCAAMTPICERVVFFTPTLHLRNFRVFVLGRFSVSEAKLCETLERRKNKACSAARWQPIEAKDQHESFVFRSCFRVFNSCYGAFGVKYGELQRPPSARFRLNMAKQGHNMGNHIVQSLTFVGV